MRWYLLVGLFILLIAWIIDLIGIVSFAIVAVVLLLIAIVLIVTEAHNTPNTDTDKERIGIHKEYDRLGQHIATHLVYQRPDVDDCTLDEIVSFLKTYYYPEVTAKFIVELEECESTPQSTLEYARWWYINQKKGYGVSTNECLCNSKLILIDYNHKEVIAKKRSPRITVKPKKNITKPPIVPSKYAVSHPPYKTYGDVVPTCARYTLYMYAPATPELISQTNIVTTGRFPVSDTFYKIIEYLGANRSPSLTRKTDILILGESPSSKVIDKANELNEKGGHIEIMTINEFFKFLDELQNNFT